MACALLDLSTSKVVSSGGQGGNAFVISYRLRHATPYTRFNEIEMNLEPSHLAGSVWKSSDAFMQLNDSTNPTCPSPRRRYRTTDEIPRSPKPTPFFTPLTTPYWVSGLSIEGKGLQQKIEKSK
jgi:hypothetical protein